MGTPKGVIVQDLRFDLYPKLAGTYCNQQTHLLWELLAGHAGLEAVAEVNVQQLARIAVQHQVAGMPVS